MKYTKSLKIAGAVLAISFLIPQASMASVTAAAVARSAVKTGSKAGIVVEPVLFGGKAQAVSPGVLGVVSGSFKAAQTFFKNPAVNPEHVGPQVEAAVETVNFGGYECQPSADAGSCAISPEANRQLQASLAASGSDMPVQNAIVFRRTIGKLLNLSNVATLGAAKTQLLYKGYVQKLKEGLSAIPAMKAAIIDQLSGKVNFENQTPVEMAKAINESC